MGGLVPFPSLVDSGILSMAGLCFDLILVIGLLTWRMMGTEPGGRVEATYVFSTSSLSKGEC